MKQLPCEKCADGKAKDPNGGPQWIGYMSSSPLWYKCFHCNTLRKLNSIEFAALPNFDAQSLRANGQSTEP